MRQLYAALLVPLVLAIGCEGNIAIFADSPMETNTPTSESPEPVLTPTGFEPGPPVLRKLTSTEYKNSVEAAFGMGFVADFILPEDQTTNGLTSIAMAATSISPLGVEQYETAGFEVAKMILEVPSLRNSLVSCDGSNFGDAECLREMIQDLGPKLYRRNLDDVEVQEILVPSLQAATTLQDFWVGVEFAIATMLQSPSFLYRAEYGESDPDRPGLRKLTPAEVATKLSFFILGKPPTDATLALVDAGGLQTQEEVREEALRLLALPEARENFRVFWTEYFGLQKIESITKDQYVYPDFDQATAQSMREETVRLMEHLVFENPSDMREMFTSTTTFVDSRLAAIYRLDGFEGSDFSQIELTQDAKRAGILGHASILALNSHSVSTSPSHRGKFIREALMCQALPPPPPNASTVIPDPDPNAGPQTLRQRLEDYFSNPACGSCHMAMDSLGFGLENYDGIGRFRTLDNGLPIDATGELNGVSFDDGVSLGTAIAQDPATMDCMVRKTYRHVVGRIEGEGDKPLVDELKAKFEASDYRFKDLVIEIAASEAFLWVQEVEQ